MDKTIINTCSDCDIIVNAVLLYPIIAHAGNEKITDDLAIRSLFISTETVNAALVLLDMIVNQAEFLSNGWRVF